MTFDHQRPVPDSGRRPGLIYKAGGELKTDQEGIPIPMLFVTCHDCLQAFPSGVAVKSEVRNAVSFIKLDLNCPNCGGRGRYLTHEAYLPALESPPRRSGTDAPARDPISPRRRRRRSTPSEEFPGARRQTLASDGFWC